MMLKGTVVMMVTKTAFGDDDDDADDDATNDSENVNDAIIAHAESLSLIL